MSNNNLNKKVRIPKIETPPRIIKTRLNDNLETETKENILKLALSENVSNQTEKTVEYLFIAIKKAEVEQTLNQSAENISFLVDALIMLCNTYIKQGFVWRTKTYVDKAYNYLRRLDNTEENNYKYFQIAEIYANDDRYIQQIKVLDYIKHILLYNEKKDEDLVIKIFEKQFKAQKILFNEVSEELINEVSNLFGEKITSDLLDNINKIEFIKVDPIENSIQYLNIKEELEEEIYQKIGFEKQLYWKTKKELLKEKYNIDWKSPKEMNTNIEFD